MKIFRIATSIIFTLLLMAFSQRAFAQPQTFTNDIGMEFVLIKPGSFILGKFDPPYPKPDTSKRNKGERGYNLKEYELAKELATKDFMPGFQVNIDRPFYIGKFEVTQAQWKKIMDGNPSIFQRKKIAGASDQHPVENVTWEQVQTFLKALNKKEKGKVYRLPTEFEWEYAARAGAVDDISWSEIRLSAQLGTKNTNEVGQKKANAWGLHDVLGNVWEWVQDCYNEKIFADSIPSKICKTHVLKGASFAGDVKNATYMTHAGGPGNGWDVGFRVVMEAE